MKKFAKLFEKLDASNKTNRKIDALVEFFESATGKDKIWALFILTGGKIKRPVNFSVLKKWVWEENEIPEWLFKETYGYVGDLSETISLLFETNDNWNDKDLEYWVNFITDLKNLDVNKQRKKLMKAYKKFNRIERFVFTKIMGGSFRVGVSKKTVINALAKLTDLDKSTISQRLTGNWDPRKITFDELVHEERAADDLSKPYPFYLAYPLDSKLKELGNPSMWSAEWKWDGIRVQLVVRSGEVFLWSRGEELITESFPEFKVIGNKLNDNYVIDGELVVEREGIVQIFNDLQTRLGRKNITSDIINDYPVKIYAYDLLEFKGEDIRPNPYTSRRAKLIHLLQEKNIKLVKNVVTLDFTSFEELEKYKENARDHYTEGLMLKKKDSAYKSGRRKGDWWKYKVDPFSIDGVLLYAQRGSGRRSNIYSDYTLGIWKDEELVPIAKAYSGLTDQQLREMNKWILKNTVDRFGPVRSVKPEIVFEIGFEGLADSNRHKSGISLRFTRILQWRKDKPAKEADTLQTVRALLDRYKNR